MGVILKNKITIILLILSGFLAAQTYEVTYNLTFKPNKERDSICSEKTILIFDIQKRESLFDYNEKRENVLFQYKVYQQKIDKHFIFYENILGKLFSSPYTPQLNWELKQEQKKVLNYKVRKATIELGGRKWDAWFTPEIPVPFGPYKFGGLPGLILKIESQDNDYSFEAVEMFRVEKEIKEPKALEFKGNKLSSLKNKIKEDPSIFLRQKLAEGFSVKVSFSGKEIKEKEILESYDKEVKFWMNQNNNPIEKNFIWIKGK